jgi:DNA polymerase III subunit gamma/tau
LGYKRYGVLVSLDTKYRPLRYADVLGQEATIKVCKEYVRQGHGFRQSYVFAGAHGGGKTTLGRILARALLCESPKDGEACDACPSCKATLVDRNENFLEVDAATNSGKEHVKRITEEAQFGSFSGGRKLYLFDESHEMSRQAMDALLKPLEDNVRGTQDKQLVAIFCTTEPEKMRSAILSRCAPVFRIRNNTPEEIGARLAHICLQENLEYEPDVLTLVAEVCECHIRDAIKAIEGVSMLGRVNRENVAAYLQLDANALYLDLLEALGFDLPKVLLTAEALDQRVSPATCYQRMADVCMLAYRLVKLGGATVPSYWDRERLEAVGARHQDSLLEFAQSFAERPYHATAAMFACDVSMLHQRRAGIVVRAILTEVGVPTSMPRSVARTQEEEISSSPVQVPSVPPVQVPVPSAVELAPHMEISPAVSSPIEPQPKTTQTPAPAVGKTAGDLGSIKAEPFVSAMGVGINPSARNDRRAETRSAGAGNGPPNMLPDEFSRTLYRAVLELQEAKTPSGRSARLDDVGGS